MESLRRAAAFVVFAGGLVVLWLAGTADYGTGQSRMMEDARGILFSADRGVVADSVMLLSDATYYPVQDTSGAVIYVKAGGSVTSVVTRRKWMTSDNATIWAYPSWVADTSGQGVAASYIGGSRYQWHITGADMGTYDFYEVGGSGPDSAISELHNVVVLGDTAPDSFVVSSSIIDGGVGTAQLADSVEVGVLVVTRVRGTDSSAVLMDFSDAGRVLVQVPAEVESLLVTGNVQLGDAISDTVAIMGQLRAIGVMNDFAGSFLDVSRRVQIAPNLGIRGDSLVMGASGDLILRHGTMDSASVFQFPENTGTPGNVLTTDGTGITSWGGTAINADFDSVRTGTTVIPHGPGNAARVATYKAGVRSHWRGTMSMFGEWWDSGGGYTNGEDFAIFCVTDSVVISSYDGAVTTETHMNWMVHNHGVAHP